MEGTEKVKSTFRLKVNKTTIIAIKLLILRSFKKGVVQ